MIGVLHSGQSFGPNSQRFRPRLTSTYKRNMEINAQKPIHQIVLANRISKRTLCARGISDLDELLGGYCCWPWWDRGKMFAESDANLWLRCCGDLISFNENQRTIRLTHHTLADILDDYNAYPVHRHHFVEVGDTCLNYSGFGNLQWLEGTVNVRSSERLSRSVEYFKLHGLRVSMERCTISSLVSTIGIHKISYRLWLHSVSEVDGKIIEGVLRIEVYSADFNLATLLLAYKKTGWMDFCRDVVKPEIQYCPKI